LFGSIFNGEVTELGVEDADVTGGDYTGVIVGLNYSDVSLCYSTGTISGGSQVGGIAGQNENYDVSTSSITNCYAKTSVSGNANVGGILGRSASGLVSNCYSIGTVTGSSATGGLIGSSSAQSSNCFWDTETSGQLNSAGGTGKTTSQMLNVSTFAEAFWDGSVWYMDSGVNDGYPYLEWQNPGGTPIPALFSGTGTTEDPLLIADKTGLRILSENPELWGYNFKQTADISFMASDFESGGDFYNGGSGFIPIGNGSNFFTGSYDGDGHTISGLFISRSGTSNVGLFGYIFNTEIKNTGLINADISGNNTVGGLVGLKSGGTISKSYSTGSVNGNNVVGGLVGWNQVNTISTISTISNSYSTGSVNGTQYIGGLVGFKHSGTISNSYSTGSVIGSSNVGGLVGSGFGGGITNSFWDTETSGRSTSYGGTGETTAGMKTQSTFTGWDFTETWEMIGDNYPMLHVFKEITVGNIGTSYAVSQFRYIGFMSESDTITVTFEYVESAASNIPPGSRTIGKYWNINSLTGNTKIRLYYTAAQKSSFTGTPKIYHYTGGEWVELPTEPEVDVDGTNFYVETTNYYSSFSPVTVGDGANPLPVELTSFTAKVNGNNVVLSWQTATEVNNYGFEVERSLVIGHQSLENWEKIGFVAGHGNSNSPKSYEFVDANPPGGSLKYRLKQIDTDGTFEYYSTAAEVNNITGIEDPATAGLPTDFVLMQNYPNPFNPVTTIKFGLPETGKVSLIVFNIIGEQVAELIKGELNPGYHEVNFGTDNLPSGLYIYRLNVEGKFSSVRKMLMVK
jgi:hypothetical protein